MIQEPDDRQLKQVPTRRAVGGQKNSPIVCVGGSAGGLDAYIRLLQNLPPDMGVVRVILNHIRNMPTQLHETLPHYNSMPVELITERLTSKKRLLITPAVTWRDPERMSV